MNEGDRRVVELLPTTLPLPNGGELVLTTNPHGVVDGVALSETQLKLDGSVVGVLELSLAHDRLRVEQLFVERLRQGQGIGSAVARRLLAEARDAGIRSVRLTADGRSELDPYAVGGYFWASLGFHWADDAGPKAAAARLAVAAQGQARQLQQECDALVALLLTAGSPTRPDFVLRLGRSGPAAGPDVTWLGKDVMLDVTWEAVAVL